MTPPTFFSRDREYLIGLACGLASALLFSLKPVLIKLIYEYGIDSLTILTWRMLISMPVYVLIGLVIIQRDPSKFQIDAKLLLKTAGVGFIGYYLAALTDLKGLQYVSAQLERLILFSYPTLVALLGWLIWRRRITPNAWLALLISYLGVSVIVLKDWASAGDQVLLGASLVMVAAISFALYVLLSKPLIDAMGSMEFTIIAMISSSIYIFIHYFITSPIADLAVPWAAWWLIFAMSIISTVLPSFLIAIAIGRIGPDQTAITSTIGPVATAVFAVILINEQFGWAHLLGLVLVVLAVFIMQRKRVPRLL